MYWNSFERAFLVNRNICGKENVHIVYGYYYLLSILENKEYWNYSSLRNYLKVYYEWATKCSTNFWEDDMAKSSLLITELQDKKHDFILFYKEQDKVFIGTDKTLGGYLNINKIKYQKAFVREKEEDVVNKISIPGPNFEDFKDKIINRKSALDIILRSDKDYLAKGDYDCLKRKEKLSKLFEKKFNNNSDIEGSEKIEWKNKYKLTMWAHIIIDGIDNLPSDILSFFFSKKEMREDSKFIRQSKILNEIVFPKNTEDGQSFEQVCNINKNKAILGLSVIVRCAIEKSIENFKGTNKKLPLFYHPTDKPDDVDYQYLLPLYFLGGKKPDCFAILAFINGSWTPVTLLNKDEARQNLLVFRMYNADFLKMWW